MLMLGFSNRFCPVNRETLYSAKFSRHIISAVFTDWPQTPKIKLAECFVLYVCIYTKHPLVHRIYFRKMFSRTNLALYGSPGQTDRQT